nr:sterol desaturase family protein [Micromonospora sp. DSM 115978]
MVTWLVGPVLAFVVLFGVFAVLERAFPSVRGQRRFRRGFLTDLAYWFVLAPVSRGAAFIAGVGALVVAALLFGVPLGGDGLRDWLERDTFAGSLPLWQQVLALLVVGDLIGYWTHRLFHRRPRLWRVHAVHHSSVDLDWLSSVRVHPLNDAVTVFAQSLPLLLLGFEFGSLGALAAVLTLYSIFVHANLDWSFGPFRYVVASPVFHRWHHTSEQEGLDRNFAGLLPVWDVLFGTFYLPRDRQPMKFGVLGDPLPEGPLGQLA